MKRMAAITTFPCLITCAMFCIVWDRGAEALTQPLEGSDVCAQADVRDVPIGPAGQPGSIQFSGINERGTFSPCDRLQWWEAIRLAGAADVSISLCGTTPPRRIDNLMLRSCVACSPADADYAAELSFCADGNPIWTYRNLPSGLHYIPLEFRFGVGPYEMQITAEVPGNVRGACCSFATSTCDNNILPEDCVASTQLFSEGVSCCEANCFPDPDPAPGTGADCCTGTTPIVLVVGPPNQPNTITMSGDAAGATMGANCAASPTLDWWLSFRIDQPADVTVSSCAFGGIHAASQFLLRSCSDAPCSFVFGETSNQCGTTDGAFAETLELRGLPAGTYYMPVQTYPEYPAAYAFEVSASEPAEPRGACCDTSTGACSDFTVQSQCSGADEAWVDGESCGVLECRAPGEPFDALNMYVVGQWDEFDGGYADVWAEGDYAYIPSFGEDPQGGRVHIIDISDPTTPTLASTFFVPFPNDSASPQDVKVADGLLFVSSSTAGLDSVVIADVRDPTTPVQIATVAIPGLLSVHNLFYADGYLYIADGFTAQVAIVDMTTFDPDNPPASPIATAKWILPVVGGQLSHDITVTNGRLYVAAWNSLRVYDVTNVANALPTELGSAPGNALHSMWPTDNAQYVVTGEERPGGGIAVFEMTPNGNLLDLTLRDSISLVGISSVHNQIIIGHRLYNSWYEAGVRIYDIDQATGQLDFVASLVTDSCWGVYPFLGDDRIILSDIQDGLLIVAIGAAPDLPPSPAIAPHDIRKNRFISFEPNLTPFDIAIRVDMLDLACSTTGAVCSFDTDCKICDTGEAAGSACVTSGTCPGGTCVVSGETCDEQSPPTPLGWVGAPFVPDTERTPPNTNTALVLSTPTMRRWAEPVIHIGDCEIAPVRTYGLRTTQDEVAFSEPLIVATIAKPEGKFWADLVGSFDGTTWSEPNLLVNVDDISAMLKFLTLRPAPHITVLDLANEQPNFLINATDLTLVLQGFGGRTYPPPPFPNQGGPADCP